MSEGRYSSVDWSHTIGASVINQWAVHVHVAARNQPYSRTKEGTFSAAVGAGAAEHIVKMLGVIERDESRTAGQDVRTRPQHGCGRRSAYVSAGPASSSTSTHQHESSM